MGKKWRLGILLIKDEVEYFQKNKKNKKKIKLLK
jgi:hypothetical protein